MMFKTLIVCSPTPKCSGCTPFTINIPATIIYYYLPLACLSDPISSLSLRKVTQKSCSSHSCLTPNVSASISLLIFFISNNFIKLQLISSCITFNKVKFGIFSMFRICIDATISDILFQNMTGLPKIILHLI